MNIYGDLATEQLAAKLDDLRTAITHGESRIDQFQLARAREDLGLVQERMELGTDVTVVALVGGTGSGKSTLFNALTDLDFADSGELRPTTEKASACTWGTDAVEMLDFLGVDPTRRIRRGSILTDEEPEFEGMILLDLPDHDSVRVNHSVQVSRLMPLVDLLIWVLDPQKYADQALHDGYLADLKRRKDSMLVVLNQIDTVPFGKRNAIVDDVKKLLASDGLDGVPVVTTSALNHEGLDEVRVHLAAAVAKDSANARTAAAELSAIAQRLQTSVGEREAVITEDDLRPVARQLSSVTGVNAVAESIRNSGETWKETALAKPEKPAAASIGAVRDGLVEKMVDGLPRPWADDVRSAVAGQDRLRREIGDAVSSVPVEQPKNTNARILFWLGISLLGLAAVLAVLMVVNVDFLPESNLYRGVLLGVLVITGIWSFTSATTLRKKSAKRAGDRYENLAGEKIIAAVEEHIATPGRQVLDEHKETREALTRVQE